MSEEASRIEYAVWTREDRGYSVKYPLPLFQEIEFVAGEGYRRIPHGGVEVGGLLFGQIEDNEVLITAFRNLECEHASGPSFVLSARDLEALSQQLESAASDPELEGSVALGWFIAHTRSGLQINERELAWFERFFPRPGQLTVLIKPERFQPTKFSFLVRSPDGKVDTDGTARAVLLPTPGKIAAKRAADGALLSIPVSAAAAPNASQSKPAAQPVRPAAPEEALPPPAPVELITPAQPASQTEPAMPAEPAITAESAVPAEPATPMPPPPEPVRPAVEFASPVIPEAAPPMPTFAETEDAQMGISPFDALIQEPPEEAEEPPIEASPPVPGPEPRQREARELHQRGAPEPWQRGETTRAVGPNDPGFAREVSRPQTSVFETRTRAQFQRPRQQITRPLERHRGPSRSRLTAVLICAALLGCLVGYYAYSQLPAVVIPLSVQIRSQRLLISWPAEQTRDTAYAAIRVDDGSPVPLSAEEKSAGVTQIPISHSNTKIEVIAQHWLRDSRGIVRYVSSLESRPDGATGRGVAGQSGSPAQSRDE